MDEFAQVLSDRLGEIYRNVIRLEEHALKEGDIDLTLGDIHLVSLLNKQPQGITVSGIAKHMVVSPPTATVAVNRLVKKGYAVKHSGEKDGRQVQVLLTDKGRSAVIRHKRCQRTVIGKLGHEFSDQEREILLRAIDKLNVYFQQPK